MNSIFDATQNEVKRICNYFQKNYPADGFGRFNLGVNCACAHCPYGYTKDQKVYDCLAWLIGYKMPPHLEKIAKGEINDK